MGITIKDVAQAAGVSTATVSRALRGLPNVDAATRDRIVAHARDLDYVISPSASRLASGRTGTVAVVTPHISRWYFSTVISGIEAVLESAGLDLLLMGAGIGEAAPQVSPATRLRRRVDAVIVVALPPGDSRLADVLDLGLPTSLVGTAVPGVSSATINDVLAGQMATQHLINFGHRRIGVITGRSIEEPMSTGRDRLRGFQEAMAGAGLPVDPTMVAHGNSTILGGEQAMTALLTQAQPPTAVFAMSDEMAFGAMKALRSHDMTIGRDVSLIGIDGHDMAEYLDLTTVVQPVKDLGRIATRSVIAQIAGGDAVDPVQLPTQLVVRGSTSPIKAEARR